MIARCAQSTYRASTMTGGMSWLQQKITGGMEALVEALVEAHGSPHESPQER